MPSPKKVREHYKKIRFHLYRLQVALNNAHNADVIIYDRDKFSAEAPCHTTAELRKRIDITTKEAMARAFREECMGQLKGVW